MRLDFRKLLPFAVAFTVLSPALSHARFYSPMEGAWLQPDRLRMGQGPNYYLYVNGQPTMATDPTGQWLNVEKSDPTEFQILESALATRIGESFYYDYIFGAPDEVRLVPPSQIPPGDEGGEPGGATFSVGCPSVYWAVSVDYAQLGAGRYAAPAEAVMVHELRHAIDFMEGRPFDLTRYQLRAYAAQIVAEIDLGYSFRSALRHVGGDWNKYPSPSDFPDSLLEEVFTP